MHIDLIINCIQEIFTEYPDPSQPDSEIIQLLKITLENNDFEFDSQFYLQVCGITMGH